MRDGEDRPPAVVWSGSGGGVRRILGRGRSVAETTESPTAKYMEGQSLRGGVVLESAECAVGAEEEDQEDQAAEDCGGEKETSGFLAGGGDGGLGVLLQLRGEGGEAAPQPMRRAQPKVGRNDPCPCGSGKKYKKCCGAEATA